MSVFSKRKVPATCAVSAERASLFSLIAYAGVRTHRNALAIISRSVVMKLGGSARKWFAPILEGALTNPSDQQVLARMTSEKVGEMDVKPTR